MKIQKKLLSAMVLALCLAAMLFPAKAEEALVPGCICQVRTVQNLVLRVKPAWNGGVLERVENGTMVSVLELCGAYAKVETEDGMRGYMISGDLVPAENKAMPQVILKGEATVIGQEDIPLTINPRESSVCIKALSPGTAVTVVNVTDDYAKVRTQDRLYGYLPVMQLCPGSASDWSDTGMSVNGAGSVWITETPDYVGLRAAPNQDMEPFVWLLDDQQVTVLGYDGRFALVNAEGRQGYVYACDILPTEEYHELKTLRFTARYTYQQMRRDAERLAQRYDHLTVGSLGLSVQGREITLITLGDPDAKKHVLIQAAIHGREYASAWMAMSMLEYALARPGDSFADGTVAEAMADTCFYIVPMANPDGVTIAQSSGLTDDLNCIYLNDRNSGHAGSNIAGYLSKWKSNANGVDLNHNFNAAWQRIQDERGKPSSESFKGYAAADQPETRALVSFSRSHKLDATISLHASGSMIYWQFGEQEEVNAQSMSLAKAVREITGYPLSRQDYNSAGGYKDWAMDELGIPSLTIEIGCRSAPLSLNEYYSVYQRCRQILPAIARWIE